MAHLDSLHAERALAALLSGTVFGVGLCLARMTDPRKVLAFLDVAGAWDPSLAFVLGGAVSVTAAGFLLVRRRRAPLLAESFASRPRTRVDAALVLGAALFGVGWGLAGYCPGPVIASLGIGNGEAWWFVPAMLAGAGLQRLQAREADAAKGPARTEH